MAFRLDSGVGGSSTPAPTIANVRQVDQQQAAANQWINAFAPTGIMAEYGAPQPQAPMSYNILPINYGGVADNSLRFGGGRDEEPGTGIPSIGLGVGFNASAQNTRPKPGVTPGWNFGELPRGWTMGPGYPMPSDWGQPQTQAAGEPVRFQDQGKGKGLTSDAVRFKTLEQAALEQYGAGSSTWNPFYRAIFGPQGQGSELDANWLARQYGIGIENLNVPRPGLRNMPDTYLNSPAGQALLRQNQLVRDWLARYTTGTVMPDTFRFQMDRLADQLTTMPPRLTPTGGGGGGTYPVRYRYYGGGGGGRGYDYGGGGYTPSWFNGLLSWRI